MSGSLDVVFLGLSITSSWGNGHATTYRALARALAAAGHRVLFLERDVPWYAENRDLAAPPWCDVQLYGGVAELRERFGDRLRAADLAVVGSYVPDGREVARLVQELARGITAFYDIDTPVTMAALARGDCAYLAAELVPGFDLYLSFTGGPMLRRIERELGARAARALYCSADPEVHRPAPHPPRWDLGYVGTYSADRQPALERLLLEPARRRGGARFAVAGPQYPADVRWPGNVDRIEHLPPTAHAAFYAAQRYTLNVTRADMVRAGWSPSVRLFEAAACGTPVLSDRWPGIDAFFAPGREILLAASTTEALAILDRLPDQERHAIGERARRRVLAEHTATHRAEALVGFVREARERNARRRARVRKEIAQGERG
ncbi:CgeB family protein [Anaeromyxobacter oryzae]|uniref:Glycosyl transferase n=1 Tax=Anaeromyxobacter oryzae TaxID=2918170 RepID=A0ABM7WRI5_9BACT|nr:glycosyltransferase [Anaeromyxobacter oryzae]BDG02088.1 glycosyl transferase [Anaeromyxobacter oryzae]